MIILPGEKVSDAVLDFAYRYPFSSEARQVIANHDSAIEQRFLRAGGLRLEEDLNARDVGMPQTTLTEAKTTYVLSYVYSRMLVSAFNNQYYTRRYAHAEAVRARKALSADTMDSMLRILSELGIEVSYMQGYFAIPFEKLLTISPRGDEFALVHRSLERGLVYLSRDEMAAAAEGAMEKAIARNLPIRASELPKEIVSYSRNIKLPAINLGLKPEKSGTYRWIEKVLATPIPDVRHRTVNLVLAPYLVNVKGMSEDEAAAIILGYIERCKEINPETRVNSTYVKYQCRYAKAKGMRPLSFERAKELFRGVINFE